MSRAEDVRQPRVAIWKLAVSSIAVGVAVVAFLAIRWPWDLSVALILALIAVLVARWAHAAFGHVVLLYACLFLIQLTVAGTYLAASVYQTWWPGPAIAGLGLIAVVCGVAWIWLFSGAETRARGI